MGRKILAITDMDSVGSGYRSICVPLFSGLAELGYDIRVAGLTYRGDEHRLPFSIVPAATLEEGMGIMSNLIHLWQPDILIVALDLPLQARISQEIAPLIPRTPPEIQAGLTIPRKYIAITPLENGPLTMSWAAPLFNMDAVFFISELGKREAQKSGVHKAEHLLVGEDTQAWHPATSQEKEALRNGLGIPQDAFVVLTVADNQERKNLWAGMAAISLLTHESLTVQDILDGNVKNFPKTKDNVRYILVTREHSPFGWKLRDLAVTLDINQEYMPFERGLPQKDLWALYAISDVYLQPSKAEGLGLPVMDAMGCGISVVATKTGAMVELLEGGRGLLVDADYSFIDVWGNSSRSMISVEKSKKDLKFIAESVYDDNQDDYFMLKQMTYRALEYIKTRTWDIPIKQMHDKIEELFR